MEMLELMKQRHSVRQYTSQSIEPEKREILNQLLQEINREGNLNVQILYDEPSCFNSGMAHYGKFHNVTNYIALVGRKAPDLEYRCGYYGEKLVLKAQELGLNTCWVALTYGKNSCAAKVGTDEKRACVIALGYGENQGIAHKSKELKEVSSWKGAVPEWFYQGMEAALLAPTAMNQQKFHFSLDQDTVTLNTGAGFYSQIDMGIAAQHFELVSGHPVRI